MTSRTGSTRRFFGNLKKTRRRTRGVRLFATRWSETNLRARGCRHEIGARWRSQHKKDCVLSSYVETFNSKSNKKVFVPETKKLFTCFRISRFLCFWVFRYETLCNIYIQQLIADTGYSLSGAMGLIDKHEPKVSRGSPEYIFQMSAVQLMVM